MRKFTDHYNDSIKKYAQRIPNGMALFDKENINYLFVIVFGTKDIFHIYPKKETGKSY